jgi:DNA-binding IclR family transcriptional regulator
MNRRTIAKYFEHLQEQKLISEKQEDGYYYLTVLEREEANLIEYTTLSKLMNVL